MQRSYLDRASDHKTSDEWDKHYEQYRPYLLDFRKEVKDKPRDQAVLAIAKLDGLVSLPILIQILTEIEKRNRQTLCATFKSFTNKELTAAYPEGLFFDSKDLMERLFKETLGTTPVDEFKALVSDKSLKNKDDLTEEKVKALVERLVQGVWSRGKHGLNKHVANLNPHQIELFKNLLRNYIFLQNAITLYVELDDRQTTTFFPFLAKKMAGFTPVTLQTPFIGVMNCAKQVLITPDTQELWEEYALWLEGLYERNFNQVPDQYKQGRVVLRLGDGSFPTVNDKDLKLKTHYPPVTFFALAEYYQLKSKIIAEKLQVTPPAFLQPVPLSPSPATPDAVHVSPSTKESVPIPERSAVKTASQMAPLAPTNVAVAKLAPRLQFFQQAGMRQILISLPEADEEVQHAVLVALGKKTGKGLEVTDDALLREDLQKVKELDDEAKIKRLRDCNYKYEYTLTQKNALISLKDLVTSAFKPYMTTSWYKTGLNNTHTTNAGQYLDKIISLQGNPKAQLLELFALRKLLKTDKSKSLLPTLDHDVFMVIYGYLTNDLKLGYKP